MKDSERQTARDELERQNFKLYLLLRVSARRRWAPILDEPQEHSEHRMQRSGRAGRAGQAGGRTNGSLAQRRPALALAHAHQQHRSSHSRASGWAGLLYVLFACTALHDTLHPPSHSRSRSLDAAKVCGAPRNAERNCMPNVARLLPATWRRESLPSHTNCLPAIDRVRA